MISGALEFLGIKKKTGYNSDFSTLIRTAKAGERKKVFLEAARRATEEQRKVIKKASAK